MAAPTLSLSPNTARASPNDCRRPTRIFPPVIQVICPRRSLNSPWLGSKLSVHSSPLRTQLPNHRPITATILFSLPTAKPERAASTEKIPKWSVKSVKSFALGEMEARRPRYQTTGTEALLMGILIEGTNLASKFLLENGITLFKVREETVKLLGRNKRLSPMHPPLTESAQRALDWAIDEKMKSGEGGEVTPSYMLLGVWSEKESPGHKVLATLGFNDEKAEELKALISKPGVVDE